MVNVFCVEISGVCPGALASASCFSLRKNVLAFRRSANSNAPMPVPSAPGIAKLCAVFSVKFNVYVFCPTGSLMNTEVPGAFAADMLPIAGNGASCLVRPCESRAVVPVLL